MGHFFDHTISVPPFDFYDVNDSSNYEFFDFLSYLMYGSFSYFILYFFDRLNLKKKHALFYIFFWSLVAIGFEWVGIKFGVYHYEKGWRLQYSLPVYLVVISVLLAIYYKLWRQKITSNILKK